MEVHAELRTRSKMFCGCAVAFGGEPNSRTCPVCLGMPGSLPVPNRAAVEMVLQTALALHCTIATDSVFHRKNYFYPDLPKGYQVSQYGETNPIGYHGWLDVPMPAGYVRRVHICRVHLEEDTGKLTHGINGGSGVDYNRAGVPLMEIVTAFPPDLQSPEEAREYLVQLRQILVHLGVCDGRMERGSLRCEPNTSVRFEGDEGYGTKTELKNLNSFRSVQMGIQFEVVRQTRLLESGERVTQETRGWNESTQSSYPMRSKEEEQDYRYFPDPDLPPMRFDAEWVESVKAALPELPLAKKARYQAEFGLSEYDSALLTAEPGWAAFFEQAVRLGGDPKSICNWMNSDLAKLLNEAGQTVPDPFGESEEPVTLVSPAHIAELTRLVAEGSISGKSAKSLLRRCFETGEMPASVAESEGLTQLSDAGAIEALVKELVESRPDLVDKYRSGQHNVAGFLVGQVMKQTQGRAHPSIVQEAVTRHLGGTS